MKILVIGLGSMGKRRIRLIKQAAPEADIIGIDANAQRTAETEKLFSVRTYASVGDCQKKEAVDCVFLCTPPLSHAALTEHFISEKKDIFTELNLVSTGYETFIRTEEPKIFLSSTFLYRKDIRRITEAVSEQNRVNYLYHTGQYLPDWHPWENYQNFFAGNRKTNGCREILAIELPWIVRCFGKIRHMSVLKDKLSDLKIDYPDNYLIQLEHENGTKGQLAVDVITRVPVRTLEIFNENMRIRWDGAPDTLKQWDGKQMIPVTVYDTVQKDSRYAANIIEDAYLDEIKAFFRWREGDASQVLHSFEADREILELIDEIEG